ncbi:MAG: hypothetical protein J6L69_01995 [Lachnospiraceae bacterium]|nr:hypothetical protein [Lachnospiraceae bacterium]
MKKKFSFFLCTLIISIALLAPSIMASIMNNQHITTSKAISYTNISSITDFAKYSTRYGYDSLADKTYGTEKQALYNEFYNTSIELWNNTNDVAFETTDLSIDLTPYDELSHQDYMEVYVTFKNDNPLFYFASNTLTIASGRLYFVSYDDYGSGSVRSNCQTAIINGINEFGQLINGKSSAFDIMITLHDKITNKISYAYESDGKTPEDAAWAHNIMGYFDSSIKKGVCECYARTLQLAMMVGGIDNLIVTGNIIDPYEPHAWNIAKLDDGKYYYIDATLNDSYSTYDYLAKGSVFYNTHAINHSNYTGEQYLYDLPTVDGNYVPKSSGTITISSVADFKYLNLYTAGNFVLGGNLDLSNTLSSETGNSYLNIKFTGTFDGKGYTIKGMKTSLFETNAGTISNLKTNADFNGGVWNNVKGICPQYKSTIAHTNDGTIKNCDVTYNITNGKGRELQTIFCTGVSITNNGTISNCTATINSVSFSGAPTEFLFLSGIAFENYGTISKCTGNFNVKNTSSDMRIDASGIVSVNMAKATIDNCTSKGSVTGVAAAHTSINGICSENNGTLKNCTNTATASLTTGEMLYTGGICGINNNLVQNCTNNGSITNNYGDTIIGMASGLGGIAGLNAQNATIKDCTNTAALSIHTGEAGGIVGSALANSTIDNCINKGNISGIDDDDDTPRRGFHVGGILGYASLEVFTINPDGSRNYHEGTVTVKNCTNEAKIYAPFGGGHGGCIVCSIYIASNKSSVEITNCTSTGIAYYNERWQNNVFGYYYHEPSGSSNQNEYLVTKGCDTSKTTFTDLIDNSSGNGGNSNSGTSKPGNSGNGGSSENSGNSTNNTTGNTNEETEETTVNDSETSSETIAESEETSKEETTSTTKKEDATKDSNDNKDDAAVSGTDDSKDSSNAGLIILIIVIALAFIGCGGAVIYIFVIKRKLQSEE